ncbi:MAG: hypothetical protein H7255_15655 [Ramlibacter sp.]|nr:hypothetical protein [Ramlibacter sp.]
MKKWIQLLGACVLGAAAVAANAEDAATLHAKYSELREPLRTNSFGRALYINSTEAGDTLTGDIYAVLDHPFKTVSEALKDPTDWCDIMILPFNTKYCRANGSGNSAVLDVRIGRKFDQPVQDAYRISFALQPVAGSGDYFESRLTAETGPVGTKDYRIAVSAVPLENGKSFMHLRYSYGYGFTGKIAMQAYLATVGANKVGFSSSGKDGNGQQVYTGGTRGAIERNAMRYYLAIDAHLASLSAPQEQRMDKRIATWFSATERYAKQLHEMDRSQYVAMKRSEYERAQTALN